MRNPRGIIRVLIVAAATTAVLSCAGAPAPSSAAPQDAVATVLISIDGFRWDYFDHLPAPNLHRLARAGVRARWMVPSFPTLTFPNHYTVATGLYPVHHGIVGNRFVDPGDGARFRYNDTTTSLLSRWWLGEPIWLTAERQGRRSFTFFWPGAEVEIDGGRPSRWRPYQDAFPNAARIDSVIDWLSLPAAERPSLVTLYFSSVDHAGHDHGPGSRELGRAVAEVDADLGRLLDGLDRRGLGGRVNIVIVSDHGMTAKSRDRSVVLDDYLDTGSVDAVSLGEFISLIPRDGDAGRVLRALAGAPHLHLYAADSVPERWHYRGSRRIAPVVGVADPGWVLTTRATLERKDDGTPGGGHGYDNADAAMRAVFIAAGPSFRRGVVVEPFQNVHVYELLCRVLGLRPAPNDGSLDSVRALLR